MQYLEHSALCCPDKIAVVDEISSCSYRELEHTCQAVGTALSRRLKVGQPVAVLMEKGISALSAFWGTVYAGGYYALLNPELPLFRLKQIQEYNTKRPHSALGYRPPAMEAYLWAV